MPNKKPRLNSYDDDEDIEEIFWISYTLLIFKQRILIVNFDWF